MKKLMILTSLLMMGCASTDLIHTNNNPKGGIVLYSSNAPKLMMEYCSPLKYKITGFQKGTTIYSYYNSNNANPVGYDENIYLLFLCD